MFSVDRIKKKNYEIKGQRKIKNYRQPKKQNKGNRKTIMEFFL